MQPRWALRFWPDTRAMVADQIGIAPDNQGASEERAFLDVCPTVNQCPLNFRQGATGSNFITALNSRSQMFPGIDYTVLYSTNDGLILPQDTPLHGPAATAGSRCRTSAPDGCPPTSRTDRSTRSHGR